MKSLSVLGHTVRHQTYHALTAPYPVFPVTSVIKDTKGLKQAASKHFWRTEMYLFPTNCTRHSSEHVSATSTSYRLGSTVLEDTWSVLCALSAVNGEYTSGVNPQLTIISIALKLKWNLLFFFLLYMPDCWLEVSIRKVLRPVTSTQVFLGFPVSISKCWDGSQDSKLPLHASHVALQI